MMATLPDEALVELRAELDDARRAHIDAVRVMHEAEARWVAAVAAARAHAPETNA